MVDFKRQLQYYWVINALQAKWAGWQLPDQPAGDSYPDARDLASLMPPVRP
jgi:hypothetical protein